MLVDGNDFSRKIVVAAGGRWDIGSHRRIGAAKNAALCDIRGVGDLDILEVGGIVPTLFALDIEVDRFDDFADDGWADGGDALIPLIIGPAFEVGRGMQLDDVLVLYIGRIGSIM